MLARSTRCDARPGRENDGRQAVGVNLLVHLLLAERTQTSAAGQILGDLVKGRLDGRYRVSIDHGIRLHRAIDRLSDAHAAHIAMRDRFGPPLRRYAGILVDIGFDHSLARAWPTYSQQSLPVFAARVQDRVRREWPPHAPIGARRLGALDVVLAGYARPDGLQRALDSVAARLTRANPVAGALPALLQQRDAFDQRFSGLFADLESHIRRIDADTR